MSVHIAMTVFNYTLSVICSVRIKLKTIIIHSKYFHDSDWLKAHVQFTKTSY